MLTKIKEQGKRALSVLLVLIMLLSPMEGFLTTSAYATETTLEETDDPNATPTPTPEATDDPTPTPEVTDDPTPTPEATDDPTPTPEATDDPTPTPETTDDPAPTPEVLCDLLITEPSMLSLENVAALEQLEPYGSETPRPVFALSGVTVEALQAVGSGRHLRIRVGLRGESLEGIFFSHNARELGLREGEAADIAFTPQINEFRGTRSVQLLITAARPHRAEELCARILRGEKDALWAAAPWCPRRSDFIRVWRLLERPGFRVGKSCEAVLRQCPAAMEPERFCLCLAVFREAGLLCCGGEALYGASAAAASGSKADLEATELQRLLHSC